MSIIDRPTATVKPGRPTDQWSGDEALEVLDELGHLDGLDDLDGLPMPLASYLEAVRNHFRSANAEPAHLIIEALDDLLAECRILGNPRNLDQFLDRRQAMQARR